MLKSVPRPTGCSVARTGALLVLAIGVLLALAGSGPSAGAAAATTAASTAQRGYVLVDNAGATWAFGTATAAGSLAGRPLRAPIVDAASTPTGLGHVMVASDGGVFTFGDAAFRGSLGGIPLNAPIVGIDVTRSGKGYILFAADGGAFTFGDAAFRGSLGGLRLNKPIVDGAFNKANDGYILTAADGGVFAFGNTRFAGSTARTVLNGPIVEIMMADDGFGYALVADDGGIFAYGGFPFVGSLGGIPLNARITDAAPSSTGDGYNLVAADGGVFAFGDAPFAGSLARVALTRPIIAILGLVNEPPKAVADAFSATEDTVLTKPAAEGVLANDTDDDGDPLIATLVSVPTKGTLVLSRDGSFTYTPTANSNGTDSFTYRATDSNGASATATARITVAAVNDAPVGVNDVRATTEDTPLTVTAPGVLTNDTDIDGNPLTAVLVAGPTNGTLALNPNGSFTYTPNANYGGTDSFTYKASDGTADSNVATVSLTVTAVDDVPVAVDDAYTTNEDTPLSIAAAGVLANDTDVEGSALGALLVAGPAKGTLTLNPNGSFTYTPDANANGPDSFTYRAGDGTADSGVATVSLTVTAVNDEPSFSKGPDVVAIEDAGGRTVPGWATAISAGPPDEASQTVTISRVSTTNDALFSVLPTVSSAGTLTYTAAPNASGSATVTLRATDSGGTANGGDDTGRDVTFVITVTPVNDAPVAVNDAYSTGEDTVLSVAAAGVLANDSDVEGSALTSVLATGPTKGSLTLNANGSFTYTPNANVNGSDSFTYRANDGAADSNVATVNLTVSAVSDAPVAVEDTYTTNEDTPLTTGAAGVLVNDTDADGNPLSATLVTGPAHGTLSLATNGSFTYTPNANFGGPDSFTYKATDGALDSNVATVSITVTAVNDAPVAVNDAYTTNEDTPLTVPAAGVLTNDSDLEGGALSAVLVASPTKGTLTLNADGSFTYAPTANANGADSFTYRASDGTADSNVTTVNITVTPVNDAPVAVNDSYTTNEDSPLSIPAAGVLGNDVDAEAGTLSAILVSSPPNGQLSLDATGAFTYTPNASYSGSDSFTYKANDGTADSNVATVNLTVTAVNDPPVAVDDGPYQTFGDTNIVLAPPGVLTNDVDIDGPPLAAANASDPANGSVTLQPDGGFTYSPDAGFLGTDSFTYDVSDGTSTDTGTVTISVVSPNAAPTADATSATGNEDGGAITVTLTGHDADGDALTFTAGTATNGLVTVPVGTTCDALTPSLCTATVTYTPNANFNGGDSFTYTVNDGSVDSAPATASITVTSVNDVPSFTKGADQTVLEDAGPRTVNGWAAAITAGPANESGQVVLFSVTNDNNGLFSVQPAVSSSGTLTYTPAADANGSATVTVAALDDGGTANGGVNTSPSQTFTISVTAVNDAPSFTKGADQTMLEDAGAQSITSWATAISDGPADEAAQTVSFTTSNDNPALFSVAPGVTPTGTLVFTSAANQYGTANVTVGLSDTGGTVNGGVDTSGTQTFVITVTPVNDSPVAAAKTFTVQANMKISLGGLLTGATDPGDVAGNPAWTPSFTLGGITAGAGCVGCTISNVNTATGTFDFEPPAGGTGSYSLRYTVVDNGFPAPGVASGAQTITFTVDGPVIWFVNGTSGSDTTGNGTLARPFATLGKAATVDAANHRIFLHGGTYADGITLLNGEWLTGAGAKATSFDVLMGITPPAGTIARPGVNGTNPLVNGTVTLGFDNTLRGLTLKGAPALTGASFGTLSLGAGASADLVLDTTGQALNLGTGTITGDFASTTSSGGTNNVLLTAVRTTTSTSLGGGSLSGATNEGFRISGGDGTFSYSGTVANADGTTVSVVNKIGGTVSFTGAVSDTAGPGVSLVSNVGSTIAFSGGVNLTSGASPAFSATSGGTVTVTGATNTLTSTGGTALTVTGTTIGSAGLSFQSISATGGTNGIVLNTTGTLAGAGGLSVTGAGTALGSGGTIRATSGEGISLTNTRATSLTNLDVTDPASHGIRGSGSTDLTLTRVQVAGAGDADNEHGVYLTNQAGTLAISGGTYSDATDNLVLVENSSTNLTVKVNDAAAFKNVAAPALTANNAIQLVPNGTSAIAATVSGATFTDIKNSSVHVGAAAAGSTGASSLTFTGAVTSGAGFAGGIVVSGQETTTTTLVVNGSTFTTAGGDGVVNSDANDSSTLLATVTNNTFSGPKGHGIVANVDETANTRVRIENNNISNAGGDGMLLTNYGGTGTSNAHFIVRNNTVNGHSLNPATRFVGGIGIFNLTPENDADTVCAAVTGNTVTATPASFFDISLQDSGTSLSFRFEENPNTAATGAVTPAFINGLNPGTTLANIANAGAQYSNGTTCQAP